VLGRVGSGKNVRGFGWVQELWVRFQKATHVQLWSSVVCLSVGLSVTIV